jgi:hypothetical protein
MKIHVNNFQFKRIYVKKEELKEHTLVLNKTYAMPLPMLVSASLTTLIASTELLIPQNKPYNSSSCKRNKLMNG